MCFSFVSSLIWQSFGTELFVAHLNYKSTHTLSFLVIQFPFSKKKKTEIPSISSHLFFALPIIVCDSNKCNAITFNRKIIYDNCQLYIIFDVRLPARSTIPMSGPV